VDSQHEQLLGESFLFSIWVSNALKRYSEEIIKREGLREDFKMILCVAKFIHFGSIFRSCFFQIRESEQIQKRKNLL
jgi:hypothetical protein